jgi:hypothetical protein
MVTIQGGIFQILMMSAEGKGKDKVDQLAEKEGFRN